MAIRIKAHWERSNYERHAIYAEDPGVTIVEAEGILVGVYCVPGDDSVWSGVFFEILDDNNQFHSFPPHACTVVARTGDDAI